MCLYKYAASLGTEQWNLSYRISLTKKYNSVIIYIHPDTIPRLFTVKQKMLKRSVFSLYFLYKMYYENPKWSTNTTPWALCISLSVLFEIK